MEKLKKYLYTSHFWVGLIVISLILPGCDANTSKSLLTVDIPVGEDQSPYIIVNKPIGPDTGYQNDNLTYSFDSKSNIDGNYSYGFDWGDGSYSWENSSISSHSWTESGIYIVRSQARCGDITSNWSNGKVVMIGSSRLSRSPLNIPGQAIQYITPDTPEMKSLINSLFSSKWKSHYSNFDACREWVAKNIRYKRDQVLYNVVDYWQFPLETLESGTGDCEDIAILLCSMLRSLGIPANQVYVAVGSPTGTDTAHAYIIERYSKGVWNIIEPQLDPITSAVSFTFLDWALTHDYSSKLYCFNDKYFFKGLPATLTSGVYEINLWHSFWPFFICASGKLEKKLEADKKIDCTLEWLDRDRILFDWTIDVKDSAGNIIFSCSGNDFKREFSFICEKSDTYSIEITKRDYSPRNVRLIISEPGWQRSANK